jgi:hypothetical protein
MDAGPPKLVFGLSAWSNGGEARIKGSFQRDGGLLSRLGTLKFSVVGFSVRQILASLSH